MLDLQEFSIGSALRQADIAYLSLHTAMITLDRTLLRYRRSVATVLAQEGPEAWDRLFPKAPDSMHDFFQLADFDAEAETLPFSRFLLPAPITTVLAPSSSASTDVPNIVVETPSPEVIEKEAPTDLVNSATETSV